MKKLSFDEAKKLFFQYSGSKMDIEHDLGDVYNDCKIPRDVELQWKQEIKQNLYNQILCEKGNALYTAIDRYCNLLKPVDANTFLIAFLSDNTMDSYTRLLLCELMKRNLKSINERSLFKKNDDKKRLFINAISDNKNLLLNSQITVDPSYKAEYKKFSPMIRYDFSESDIKKEFNLCKIFSPLHMKGSFLFDILTKYEYVLTEKSTDKLPLLDTDWAPYTYAENSDRLVSYNGEIFAYDLIGNPTTYRGKTATWAYGRQRVSYDGNTFAYDARGRRTAKNNNNITFI